MSPAALPRQNPLTDGAGTVAPGEAHSLMREAQSSLEEPQSDEGGPASPGRVCSLGARERKGRMLLPGGAPCLMGDALDLGSLLLEGGGKAGSQRQCTPSWVWSRGARVWVPSSKDLGAAARQEESHQHSGQAASR